MSPHLSNLIGVVDVETTGLFPARHDRVVEVAAVVIEPSGRIVREFVSLVNPARDIGPSSIHGLTSEDVLHAPLFQDIASVLVEALEGTVAIAAHNVTFDNQFLEHEFARMNQRFPQCLSICTMRLAGGGRLANCCADYAIPFDGESHHALADARAAARLLAALLSDQPRTSRELMKCKPIEWPRIVRTDRKPITRDDSRRRQSEPPTYLQRLLGLIHCDGLMNASDGAVIAYCALLDRVLEDRQVEDSEGEALVEMAAKWGMTSDQIKQAHREYLNRLAIAAVADGIVTDAELRDLKLVARLLGQERNDLDQLLREAATKLLEAKLAPAANSLPIGDKENLKGKTVCFTGELQCRHNGELISRELAEEFATRSGLVATDSVTKKLDLLVVADPHSQSGKATKARKYGVRILHEPVFWNALGVKVE